MASYLVLAVILCCVAGLHAKPHHKFKLSGLNFVGSRMGKWHEVRVAHNGVLALEMTIPGRGEKDLFLRLVSDGKHVIKLIYSDRDTLATCEIENNDQEEVEDFLSKFTGKDNVHPRDLLMENLVKNLGKSGNFTYHSVHTDGKLTSPYKEMIELHHLRKLCHENHETTKRNVKAYNKMKGKGTRRTKRELIYPGTKWCGKGSTSTHYDDLGESRDEDKCCREHDFCEYMIEGLTTKWGYFNARLTTISHCDCDDRFISCLKILNTQPADMIGDLYFNIAKTECFVFKKVKSCSKRKWWGKCVEYEYVYRVHVQEAFPYQT